MCAVYISNRVFTGHKPNLANMHSFGTICFAYVQEKKKLDARGERGVFIGYDKGRPAYLIYYPESRVIRKSRCVRFTEKFQIEDNRHVMSLTKPTLNQLRKIESCPILPIALEEIQGEIQVILTRKSFLARMKHCQPQIASYS
jgi:hypothetical protein